MIDTRHSTEPTTGGDQELVKRPTVPRRHFSFHGNDIASCDNVCVQSIINQLGEKLDIGKPRVQKRIKHSSFQSDSIQITNASDTKARSRSMMISRFNHVMPVRLLDVVSHTPESSQGGNDTLEVSQMHSSNASLQPPSSPNFHLSSTSLDLFGGQSPGSLGSSRSRWGLSRRMNHGNLPPAFRDSLDNSILGSNTARRRHSVEGKPDIVHARSSSVNRGKYPRSPSKLQRTWPPLPRKDRRPSQHELLESSLSDLRLMACVQSQIPSFEPPPLPVFSSENENQAKEEVAESSSSNSLLKEEDSENRGVHDSSSGVQPEILGLNIPGLASAIKSGKCKGSLRIRWSGPEVFFIEGRHHKSFQPLYYDDLLEDRFQSVSEHSVNKPLLMDRFGARVNDSSPGLPNRPRRYDDDDDDWSDYEDEVDDGQSHGEQGPMGPSQQSVAEDIPTSPPMIWITRLDDDSTANCLYWRVRRVWDNPKLDSLEKDRIIPDEDLLNTLKNLSGLPAIPTDQLLEHANKVAETSNTKPLLPWSIQKVYDIDGEIMDELCSLSEVSVEEGVMLDAIVAFSKETLVSSSPQQMLSSSLVEDDWNFEAVHEMVTKAPQDSQGPLAHLEESISVLETDDGLSLRDSRGELLRPTSNTRSNALSNIKVSVMNSTCLDSINRGSSGARVIPSESKGAVPSSGLEEDGANVEPEGIVETKEKKKNKRRDHGTLASLLSPPPVLKFL